MDLKRIEEAIVELQKLFDRLTTPKLISVDSPAYCLRNSLGTALSILQAVKEGKLVEPASEEEIEAILANTPTPSSDGDIHPGEFHIIAKALAGKIGKE